MRKKRKQQIFIVMFNFLNFSFYKLKKIYDNYIINFVQKIHDTKLKIVFLKKKLEQANCNNLYDLNDDIKIRLSVFNDLNFDDQFMNFCCRNEENMDFFNKINFAKTEYIRLLFEKEILLKRISELKNAPTNKLEWEICQRLLSVIDEYLSFYIVTYFDLYSSFLDQIILEKKNNEKNDISCKDYKNYKKAPSLEIYFNIKWSLKSVLLRFSGIFFILLFFSVLYLYFYNLQTELVISFENSSLFEFLQFHFLELKQRFLCLFKAFLALVYFFAVKLIVTNLPYVLDLKLKVYENIISYFDIANYNLSFIYEIVCALCVFSLIYHVFLALSHFSVLKRNKNAVTSYGLKLELLFYFLGTAMMVVFAAFFFMG